MDENVLKELKDRKKFADNIKIEPYEMVQEFLDDIAAGTAKEAAEGMVKLFERLLVRRI